jgi:hypothetical protein
MKGFDEKGVMNFVWSEVLKCHVFTVRLSSLDSIPNRYWMTKVTMKYAVFFRMRDGVSLPVMFRCDYMYSGNRKSSEVSCEKKILQSATVVYVM